MMSSAELRQRFLAFFHRHGHEVVPSASLVPHNDPTLLFTNAGMVPFKNVFLGQEQRPYDRAASSQRCVRAGGKHNDLDNVGYTARHHTFFEMLGNFSFGDYFKREAIRYSWQFLTEELGLPAERLWVTVFEEDDEAADIWLKEMNVSPERFSRCGAKDNFWSMGNTGPCGPCSEIFYDHGPEVAGGPPGSPGEELDRYIEIWNLVFMQYDRLDSGDLELLPKPAVDTGMGLERISAVMQGVHNNFATDLFVPLIARMAELAHCDDLEHTSLRVIADHIRACAFLITDGVIPANEGRGYVLRRIIRRAVRHGYKLGMNEPFFYRLVATLEQQMGTAYPELTQAKAHVEQVLEQEEIQFAKTLEQGLKLLEQDISHLNGDIIPGKTIFKLYDTYGFPPDLTGDIARERHLQLDMQGFEQEMQKQRALSQNASKFATKYPELGQALPDTDFVGYDALQQRACITAISHQDNLTDSLKNGEQGVVFLDSTPFYAESGGQVGDQGILESATAVFQVQDTQKQGKAFAHIGTVIKGELKKNDQVLATVDHDARRATVLNHSATHLLHAALRQVLGAHVVQKGSLVAPERLRFDFTHHEPLSAENLSTVEKLVNAQVRANLSAKTHVTSPEEATKQGALALFGEKYDEKVRVLTLGDFSKELCGGTHVTTTGEIGLFKIISETGVAAGIRRIEAVTGAVALDWVNQLQQQMNTMGQLLKTNSESVSIKVQQLLERVRSQDKAIEQLKAKLASQSGQDLAQQVIDIAGVKVLSCCIEGVDGKTLRQTLDKLKNQLGSAVIVLATVADDKVTLIAGVSKDCTDRFHAGELITHVAKQVGGKGGGRPDMAQAGGNQPEQLESALASVENWVREQLINKQS